MPMIALNVGTILVVLGILAFVSPTIFAQNGEPFAKTSLIPTGVGILLEICGILALSKPLLRKHMMHLAAMVGLIGAIGGLMPIFRGGLDFSKASVVVGTIMTILCTLFVALCVRSFIAARKARLSAGN